MKFIFTRDRFSEVKKIAIFQKKKNNNLKNTVNFWLQKFSQNKYKQKTTNWGVKTIYFHLLWYWLRRNIIHLFKVCKRWTMFWGMYIATRKNNWLFCFWKITCWSSWNIRRMSSDFTFCFSFDCVQIDFFFGIISNASKWLKYSLTFLPTK